MFYLIILTFNLKNVTFYLIFMTCLCHNLNFSSYDLDFFYLKNMTFYAIILTQHCLLFFFYWQKRAFIYLQQNQKLDSSLPVILLPFSQPATQHRVPAGKDLVLLMSMHTGWI